MFTNFNKTESKTILFKKYMYTYNRYADYCISLQFLLRMTFTLQTTTSNLFLLAHNLYSVK